MSNYAVNMCRSPVTLDLDGILDSTANGHVGRSLAIRPISSRKLNWTISKALTPSLPPLGSPGSSQEAQRIQNPTRRSHFRESRRHFARASLVRLRADSTGAVPAILMSRWLFCHSGGGKRS